jgi:hypothetical protein
MKIGNNTGIFRRPRRVKLASAVFCTYHLALFCSDHGHVVHGKATDHR